MKENVKIEQLKLSKKYDKKVNKENKIRLK